MIEDHKEVRDFVKEYFDHKEIEVIEAQNGYEGLAILDDTIDIILLDIMMPGIDGYEVCKQIRSQYNTLIVFISALSEDENQLKAYEYGADDYITKPFLPEELILRVKAVLKRTYHMEETMKNEQIGAAQVDWNAGVIRNGAEEYALTAKEYTLLRKLSENRGRILSMNVLCDTLWPDGSYGYENSLMVHIRRLREKIEENPSKPEHILTVRGLGYKLI